MKINYFKFMILQIVVQELWSVIRLENRSQI